MFNTSLETLVDTVRRERLSRRDALRRGLALGLSAPALATLLAACGDDDDDDEEAESTATSAPQSADPTSPESDDESADSDDEPEPTPEPEQEDEPEPTAEAEDEPTATPEETDAERSGTLSILWWQAPALLNGHLTVASKDIGAILVCMEPLAHFGPDAELVPYLASEIPSEENGSLAEDRTSVTWKLREGVKWHDGEDFNADDVVFTFEYLTDPATNATTLGFYNDVESVEAIDDYTVQVNFKYPVAPWFNPFVGNGGTILPEHVLRDSMGQEAEFAPFNLMPIGTGPFKVVDFNPGDVVIYEAHEEYWDTGKPYFDRVELKGGGDAASAARAVLQTTEGDWAWNLQVEATVLEQLESTGDGQLVTWPGAGTEKLVINHSDPDTEMEGQRSHRDVPHPHLSELTVRQAIAQAIPRDEIASGLYGFAGEPTGYSLNSNPDFMPPGITWEYDLDRASAMLDEVGAIPGDGGIRVLNDQPMIWTSSASTNSLRQKEQEIIKESFAEIGIELEIVAIEASVYFDAANIDSFQHLYFDFGMERNSGGIYPIRWYLRYYSGDPEVHIAQQENGWSGRNFGRYQSEEFNELFERAEAEPLESEYLPIFREMQQLVVDEVADIGLVSTNNVSAASSNLVGFNPTPYSIDVWDIKNWRREG